jgi:outer membrane cobalamin receptor
LPFTPDLPNFDVTGSANLRLTKKLSGFSDLKLTGQRYGLLRNPSGDEKIALKPLYQLNAGVEYALKPKLKVFGRADNLLNEHYDQWLGYTTQGLRLLAGITFSF